MNFLHFRSKAWPWRMLMYTSASPPTSMEKPSTLYLSLLLKVSVTISYCVSICCLHTVPQVKILCFCSWSRHWTSKRCWRNGRSLLSNTSHDSPKPVKVCWSFLWSPLDSFASRNIYRMRSKEPDCVPMLLQQQGKMLSGLKPALKMVICLNKTCWREKRGSHFSQGLATKKL